MQLRGLLTLVAAFAVIGFAKPASAGVHLEPYVGFAKGTFEQTSESDSDGMLFGARVGYSIPMFAFGVEYMGGSLKDEDDDTAKPGDIGVFAEVEFPVLVRAFATYFVKSKAAIDGGDLEGTGMKVGIGFTVLPLLSINLEYLATTYDKFEDLDLSPEAKFTGYMLSVSLPLDI